MSEVAQKPARKGGRPRRSLVSAAVWHLHIHEFSEGREGAVAQLLGYSNSEAMWHECIFPFPLYPGVTQAEGRWVLGQPLICSESWRGGGGGEELRATQRRLMLLLLLAGCHSDTSLLRALTSDASDKLCCQSKAFSQTEAVAVCNANNSPRPASFPSLLFLSTQF